MTLTGTRSRMSRTLMLLASGGVLAASAVAVGPAAAAATPHANPAVSQVRLSSKTETVKTSTGRRLRLQLVANQLPGSNAASDDVLVTLSDGPQDVGETHEWDFPVSASALKLTRSGQGWLQVPPQKILPYGIVKLTVTPSGKPKTDSCAGAATDRVQPVRLAGAFYFDTKSTGAHKWGVIGSKNVRKKFLFSGLGNVTWFYPEPAGGTGCGSDDDTGLPCSGSLFWDDPVGDVDLSGVTVTGANLIEASRNVQLPTPVGASRADELTGIGAPPVLTTTPDAANPASQDASLAVSGDTGAVGSATITSADPGQTQSLPCDGGTTGETASVSLWQGCTFTNGTTPLAVPAEIFGAISVPDTNTQATLIDVAAAS